MTTSTPTSTGALFKLTKIAVNPTTPAVNQPTKITGDITLFGIPYVGLAWVIADITYPKQGLDLTNPVSHVETIAFGGKFTIDCAGGFDRQGSFSSQITCYLGPTVKENLGVGGIVTLPPLPNIASVTFNFAVSGNVNTEFTVGTPVGPATVVPGGPVDFAIPITNNTQTDTTVVVQLQVKQVDKILFIAWNGTSVQSISSAATLIKAGQTVSVGFKYTETSTTGTRSLVVTVNSGSTVVGNGSFASIYNVVAPAAPSLTISPNSVNMGVLMAIVVNNFAPNEIVTLTNQGSTTVLASFSVDASGWGIFSLYPSIVGSYTMVATGASGKTASAAYTIKPAAGNGKVTITNANPSNIPYSDAITFSISGFPAYSQVTFSIGPTSTPVPGTVATTITTDSQGNGNGSFAAKSFVNGTYYLVVTSTSGYGTSASFTITGGPNPITIVGGQPAILLTANSVMQYGTLNFEVTNFEHNGYVNVYTPDGSNISVATDDNGFGQGSFTDYEPQGDYTLEASDGAGNFASIPFTVLSQVTKVSFKVQLASIVYKMLGTQLVSPLGVSGATTAVSWYCSYFDPVTNAFVQSTPNPIGIGNAASFNNVHPGGYLVLFLTDGTNTTSQINSSNFAAKNGDLWYENPYMSVAGQAGDILQTYNGNGGGGGTTTSTGPQFPAPGTAGDGYMWYWCQFYDGTYGWDDSDDALASGVFTIISGPYNSGATS